MIGRPAILGYAGIVILAIAVLGIAVALAPLLPATQPAVAAPQSLSVTYQYSAEAAYEEIRVNESMLVHTFFAERTQDCDAWVKQSPCWKEQDLTTVSYPLTPAQVSRLRSVVQSTGFMSLDPVSGGVNDGQRSYPYTISVNDNGTEKTVVYQSFPGASPEPAAFVAVRDALVSLNEDVSGLR
ncbi:MAG: hypothetical protein GYA23_00855 [Methanomicrobiales archaeon]|nr:hypothetical protein [Methanomicrobiales archaeon]